MHTYNAVASFNGGSENDPLQLPEAGGFNVRSGHKMRVVVDFYHIPAILF